MSVAKNYCPVSLLNVVSKVFQLLVNNRLADFRYGFRSSRSTADLLTAVSDTVGRAYYSSGAYILKTFDRV